MSSLDYAVCATTSALNMHEAKQDKLDYQTNDTFDSITNAFKYELSEASCKEDIHDDLIFEIKSHIDRYSYEIDADNIEEIIFQVYDIKGAE